MFFFRESKFQGDDAAVAYKDAVDRFLGEKVDLKFLTPKPVGLVSFP